MATQALTTGGSRTFQDGVQISWTPSSTTNSVDLQISIGGSLVWDDTVQGNGNVPVEADGDNYKITGVLEVQFSASGSDGQVKASGLKWTVEGSSHSYDGLVGIW
ncbi:MAG TPA: hypothetical protein VEI24_04560 [Nitrospiria bacterium]|jgi:hypothetical protein|nr:hypothetical protein [Nitrospiria bacterium]